VHAVRKRILEYLKEYSGATVADLARELEMASVSIRHHLDILQGDGLICVARVKRKGNVGRPQQVYTLTSAANAYFPNNFAALAEGLVGQIKVALPPDQVQCAFQALAGELAADFDDAIEGDEGEDADALPSSERVARIADFLTEQGYLARWEPLDDADDGAEGFLLHKHNCPYAGVSESHQELCMMDQELVNRLVGQPCQRIRSLAEDGACCTYRIELSDNELPDSADIRANAKPALGTQSVAPLSQ